MSSQKLKNKVAEKLAKIDSSISNSNKNVSRTINELTAGYEKLLQNFERIGELENSVFIYSVALAKKVRKAIKGKF